MKFYTFFLTLFLSVYSYAQLPEGFVYVKDIIPDLDVELRYYTSNNFVGKPIIGYNSNTLILTEQATKALKKIQDALQQQNLCLKVFDGYRPQQSVNYFIIWARDLSDTINKQLFYPYVKKRNLFNEGYIASRSGHSKGSTVDVTIIDGNTGNDLDMGSRFDFFGQESWVYYDGINKIQKANRQLLQSIMKKYGFRNYSKEWWHFTLINEPFPNTYFNFPVE
ncbi:peptidase M15 [Pseudalgibacter alginicilyticus]|uniref:D-alanyl-D-alanine dipeptidase n=1 Tax=Pseudalgibacter alginicilyticus TaxID=1736674 RepID=A0A0P0CF29_9FLAO|nr:M15 family metallopeptidase [Pseudalgibacter alginicilyticus]ALJ04621.1 peptidase M15 [Pseudalgibacter alginicilyticus]